MLQGNRHLARAFGEAYFEASGDSEGRVLTFYSAYRAAVRGKVEGLKLARPEITAADRIVARAKSQGS
jgi:aminoglycoside phosphotransferase family enzyme